MNESDAVLATQMLAYCDKIGERIDEFGIDEDAFVDNSAYADMILMPVFQIGELAHGLSDEFCEELTCPLMVVDYFDVFRPC